MTEEERRGRVRLELVTFIVMHPTAKILTDVGASMFSGYGELDRFEYDPNDNTITLEFD